MTDAYPQVIISETGAQYLRQGQAWMYRNNLVRIEDAAEDGGLVRVLTENGEYLGTGFCSLTSHVTVRILTRDPEACIDREFFRRRLASAYDFRKTVEKDNLCDCRLVFGEADGLPGLTIDRYGDVLVSQVLSYGMEQHKGTIYRLLAECLQKDGVRVRGVFERNEAAIRELEGLPLEKGWYGAEFLPEPPSPLLEITENGIRYAVDVENGQKTGFFLDQKYNRLAVAKIARGKRVLDCFTHTGSFALNAAAAGAVRVTAVDVSQPAVDLARGNAALNGLEGQIDFVCADVFDLLPQLIEQHAAYDYIILDPPAFTKSRKTIQGAERGYKSINYSAMKLLPRGGYLATCSCSHFMESDMFLRMLLSAARDAGVSLKLVEARRQSPDHPTLMNVPETDYLKFYIFQIV